jgi:serine-type D-Ala-D-Ala carboxypeptidase/endopeptidase
LGLHLDPSVPAGTPRIAALAEAKLIDGPVGQYRLPVGLRMELRHKGNVLAVQAGGHELEIGYDSAGDFYALQLHALLRPTRKADGTSPSLC